MLGLTIKELAMGPTDVDPFVTTIVIRGLLIDSTWNHVLPRLGIVFRHGMPPVRYLEELELWKGRGPQFISHTFPTARDIDQLPLAPLI